MAISEETRSYVDGLIAHYVSEARSYRQLAESCADGGSVEDTAVGMIVGCIYSAFLQLCRDGGTSPALGEINELVTLINARVPDIRRAMRPR